MINEYSLSVATVVTPLKIIKDASVQVFNGKIHELDLTANNFGVHLYGKEPYLFVKEFPCTSHRA